MAQGSTSSMFFSGGLILSAASTDFMLNFLPLCVLRRNVYIYFLMFILCSIKIININQSSNQSSRQPDGQIVMLRHWIGWTVSSRQCQCCQVSQMQSNAGPGRPALLLEQAGCRPGRRPAEAAAEAGRLSHRPAAPGRFLAPAESGARPT